MNSFNTTEVYESKNCSVRTNFNPFLQWKNFEKHFKMEMTFEEFKKSKLTIKMVDLERKVPISTYIVDFLSLAVGPIHHAIEFTDHRRKYIGKFSGDILFSQLKTCHVNLEEIKLQIFGEQEKAYNVSFKVLSHYQFYQSKKSVPKIGHKEKRKMIKAQANEEDEELDTYTNWHFGNI